MDDRKDRGTTERTAVGRSYTGAEGTSPFAGFNFGLLEMLIFISFSHVPIEKAKGNHVLM